MDDPDATRGLGHGASELLDCAVVEARRLADDLILLRLAPPRRFVAEPGQFAMLRPTAPRGIALLGRPMSVLGAGDEASFLIRRCGQGTEALAALRAGDRVAVLGPLGRGWGSPATGAAPVLVAGGVGLAPLLFAAREMAGRGLRARVLYGARTASQLVLTDDAATVAALEVATDDGSAGHHGPVTELLEPALRAAGGAAEVWTCGPEGMMERVARIALGAGLRCKVSLEARMACGRGLCLGCARLDATGAPRYVCSDGPVLDAELVYPGAWAGGGGV